MNKSASISTKIYMEIIFHRYLSDNRAVVTARGVDEGLAPDIDCARRAISYWPRLPERLLTGIVLSKVTLRVGRVVNSSQAYSC